MTERELKTMVSLYASSWPAAALADEPLEALRSALYGYGWGEAAGALSELVNQHAKMPSVLDIMARLEQVRHRPSGAPANIARGQAVVRHIGDARLALRGAARSSARSA